MEYDEWRPRITIGPVIPPRSIGPDLTRAIARGPKWRRVGRGSYLPVDVPETPEQRVANVATALPPNAVVTGWGRCA